ncbi:hypothetical protein LguiA_021987 [Lonicera macranthoides]
MFGLELVPDQSAKCLDWSAMLSFTVFMVPDRSFVSLYRSASLRRKDRLRDNSGLGLTVAGDKIGEDTDKEDYETNSESLVEEDSVVALRGLFEESDSLDELHRELNPKRQPCTDFTGPCYSKIIPVGSSFNFGPGTLIDSPSFPLTFDCYHNSPNNCLVEMGKDRTNNFEKVDISKPWGNYQNVLIKQCNCGLKSNETPHFHCTENAINKIFEGVQESGKAVGKDKADNVTTLLNEMNLKLVPIKKGKGNRARKAYDGPEGSRQGRIQGVVQIRRQSKTMC